MLETKLIETTDVRVLARTANLPLGDDRLEGVVSLLNAWLPAANALSRKMSAAEHRVLLPITVLAHAATTDSTD